MALAGQTQLIQLLLFLFFLYRFFLGFRTFLVQVVGNTMAVAALGEVSHDAGRMGCTMATLACRHHLVFIFMACGAGNGFVLCSACCKHGLSFPVT